MGRLCAAIAVFALWTWYRAAMPAPQPARVPSSSVSVAKVRSGMSPLAGDGAQSGPPSSAAQAGDGVAHEGHGALTVGGTSSGSAATDATATATGAIGQRPVIMLDPGHGGTNSGAPSIERGVWEKQITLRVALLTQQLLQKRGYDARLTRASDDTLTLRQRMALALEARAAAFVSIHANASPSRLQHGFETFVLSARAIDIDTAALRGDLVQTRPGVDIDTARLLDDLERGAAQKRSLVLAERIQAAMAKVRPHSTNRGVRQESQHVLLGATMPAVLLEIGFLDHPREGRELADSGVQAQLAAALADAIAATVPLHEPAS